MIFDMTVLVGRWPFRRLSYAGAAGARQLMSRTGTCAGLAVPLQGAFYVNPMEAVAEMVEDLRATKAGLTLHPCAVVNPSFPGWERDLSRAVTDLGCVACALFPTYHGYQVYDSAADGLFSQLTAMGLPTMLFIRLQDERSHHWRMQVPAVPIQDCVYLCKTYPDLPLAIANCNLPVEAPALAAAIHGRSASTLVTTSYKSLHLARMVELLGVSRLAYASALPLFYPESALLQVRNAPLESTEKTAILAENGRAFLGLAGESNVKRTSG
jgi:predicted TIM-barrel fold metal-dependent hydrolase